jgi:hypothetical protein
MVLKGVGGVIFALGVFLFLRKRLTVLPNRPFRRLHHHGHWRRPVSLRPKATLEANSRRGLGAHDATGSRRVEGLASLHH